MGVGSQIKEALKAKGMTIKALSEKTGIPLNTLYSITKRDEQSVRSDILTKIAHALGTDFDSLLYGEGLAKELKFIRGDDFFDNQEIADTTSYGDKFLEGNMLKNYRLLNGVGQRAVQKFVSALWHDAYFTDKQKNEQHTEWAREANARMNEESNRTNAEPQAEEPTNE